MKRVLKQWDNNSKCASLIPVIRLFYENFPARQKLSRVPRNYKKQIPQNSRKLPTLSRTFSGFCRSRLRSRQSNFEQNPRLSSASQPPHGYSRSQARRKNSELSHHRSPRLSKIFDSQRRQNSRTGKNRAQPNSKTQRRSAFPR